MDSEYVSLTEATRLTGISRPTMRRIVGRGGLERFRCEADQRVVLVRRADVEALTKPVPQQQPSENGQRQGAAA